MPPKLNGTAFKLTNADVKRALPGYDRSRSRILRYLLAYDAFGEKGEDGPFGFDLSRVNDIRKAIAGIVDVGTQQGSALDPFRKELIFATADATRREPVSLVLHLYTALMERHAQDPPDDEEVNEHSKAGEYLLRCMAVQAAYDNIMTYGLILEQFARVVAAIKNPGTFGHDGMLERLLELAGTPLNGIEKETQASYQAAERTSRRRLVMMSGSAGVERTPDGVRFFEAARATGAELARKGHVVLTASIPPEFGPAFTNAAQAGCLAAGGRVVRLAVGEKIGWRPSRQVLEVIAPAATLLAIVWTSSCYDQHRSVLLDGENTSIPDEATMDTACLRPLQIVDTLARDAAKDSGLAGLEEALALFLAADPSE